MSEPFVAEIRIFPGNFAPIGWALCNGQLLPIAQNTALFSLLGTTYGGDGESTFALPNLQGRAPMHPGHGPGLTGRNLGERGGTATVTLTESQIPSHSHGLLSSNSQATTFTADATSALARSVGGFSYSDNASAPLNALHPSALGTVGGGQPHNNLQPYLALNFIIALVGVFPPSS